MGVLNFFNTICFHVVSCLENEDREWMNEWQLPKPSVMFIGHSVDCRSRKQGSSSSDVLPKLQSPTIVGLVCFCLSINWFVTAITSLCLAFNEGEAVAESVMFSQLKFSALWLGLAAFRNCISSCHPFISLIYLPWLDYLWHLYHTLHLQNSKQQTCNYPFSSPQHPCRVDLAERWVCPQPPSKCQCWTGLQTQPY